MPTPDGVFLTTLARARADPNVQGLVVFGSRGPGVFVTDRSDYDAFVVLEQPDPAWCAGHVGPVTAGRSRRAGHVGPVELVPILVGEFDAYALAGSPSAWNRPAFLGARVVIDRLDGGIARMVEMKARLDADEAASTAADALDDYVNSLYRSLGNGGDGRELAARLDAGDAIGPLLTFLFAIDGRVRPFAKYLEVEVAKRPLVVSDVLPRIATVLAAADPVVQRAVFRDVETVAREQGLGAVIDAWEPDLAFMRGDAPRH